MKILNFFLVAATTAMTLQANAGTPRNSHSFNGELISAMLSSQTYQKQCESKLPYGIVIQSIENKNDNGHGAEFFNNKVGARFKVSLGEMALGHYCIVVVTKEDGDFGVNVEKVKSYGDK